MAKRRKSRTYNRDLRGRFASIGGRTKASRKKR